MRKGFLLFEILMAGMLLSIWFASLLFFFQQMRVKQQAILSLEKDLYAADSVLARAFSDGVLDPEKYRGHSFGGGLQLIEIPIGSRTQSLWVVVQ